MIRGTEAVLARSKMVQFLRPISMPPGKRAQIQRECPWLKKEETLDLRKVVNEL